jgi:hypothetical protein
MSLAQLMKAQRLEACLASLSDWLSPLITLVLLAGY